MNQLVQIISDTRLYFNETLHIFHKLKTLYVSLAM